jgi:hypothetical protein
MSSNPAQGRASSAHEKYEASRPGAEFNQSPVAPRLKSRTSGVGFDDLPMRQAATIGDVEIRFPQISLRPLPCDVRVM